MVRRANDWGEYTYLYRLYESPKKQVFVERNESALAWSRHVLDNPSPEMEVARRVLINRLNQRKQIIQTHTEGQTC